MKRSSAILLLALGFVLPVIPASDEPPTVIAQKLFDAMKAHDSTGAAALFLPGATLASINAEGKPSVVPFEKFVEHIGSSKSMWLEQMWNPKVLQQRSIAVVWGEYDFHLDGKLSHCGIDAFTMLKTETGWRISAISDTRETSGCKQRP